VEFETSVRIERAVDEVFDYVSDPRNFPRWNSAVEAVSVTSGQGDPVPRVPSRSAPSSQISPRHQIVTIRFRALSLLLEAVRNSDLTKDLALQHHEQPH
jgi:uncharacterized protein YndB with AHSA1/START domain